MALTATDLDAINKASQRTGVPADLLQSMAMRESSGNPTVVNPTTGATGLFQVLQSTAADPGYGVAPLTDRTDPYASANFAADYLKAQYTRTGSWASAVNFYSGGSYQLADLANVNSAGGTTASTGATGGSMGTTATGGSSTGSTSSTSSTSTATTGVMNGIWEIVQRAGLLLVGGALVLVAIVAMLWRSLSEHVDVKDLAAVAAI
jgi:hypothetical protein